MAKKGLGLGLLGLGVGVGLGALLSPKSGEENRKALKKHVNKVMKYWADKEERGEITREEYYKKCPYEYEAWSCSCGKWTGNFKYD